MSEQEAMAIQRRRVMEYVRFEYRVALDADLAYLEKLVADQARAGCTAAEARLAKCEMARLGCAAPCNPQEAE